MLANAAPLGLGYALANADPLEYVFFGAVLIGLGLQVALLVVAVRNRSVFVRKLSTEMSFKRRNFLLNIIYLSNEHVIDAATHITIKLIFLVGAIWLLLGPAPVAREVREFHDALCIGSIFVIGLMASLSVRAYLRRVRFESETNFTQHPLSPDLLEDSGSPPR